MTTHTISRRLGCPLTIRDSDKRVRVRHLGEHHWITKENYCAMVVRGFIDESLGHPEPFVKLETGITFTVEEMT